MDIEKALNAPLEELHLRTLPGHKKYNYCGPGADLKRLERGDKGINCLDEVYKQHDIDYDDSDTLADKHVADQKMIEATEQFPNQNLTEPEKSRTSLRLKSYNLFFSPSLIVPILDKF